jgi:hypothetical protein
LFDQELLPETLPEAIRGAAKSIERDKYSSRSWTARR